MVHWCFWFLKRSILQVRVWCAARTPKKEIVRLQILIYVLCTGKTWELAKSLQCGGSAFLNCLFTVVTLPAFWAAGITLAQCLFSTDWHGNSRQYLV